MDVSRRVLLAAALAVALDLLDSKFTVGAGQEAAATPTASISDWIVAAVVRRFRGTGAPPQEVARFAFWAFALDSVDHARVAFPVVVDDYRNLWRTELAMVDAPAIGEERVAFEAMDVRQPSSPESPPVSYGLLVWREGTVIVVASGSARETPLPDLIAVGNLVAEREPGPGPVTETDDGFHVGGIWDVLPTPEEMPTGIEFEIDVDHSR